ILCLFEAVNEWLNIGAIAAERQHLRSAHHGEEESVRQPVGSLCPSQISAELIIRYMTNDGNGRSRCLSRRVLCQDCGIGWIPEGPQGGGQDIAGALELA